MSTIIILIFVAAVVVLSWCCCKVSGDSDDYFMNDDGMKTLTFYMNTLVNANNTVAGQGVAAAASLIMFLPNLILFIILQNSVMNTMANSGIK